MKRKLSTILLMVSFVALFACTKSKVDPTSIAVEGVGINKATISIEIGKTETLLAVITPAEAENKAVIWSTSDETIATVSPEGVVEGIKEGVATITVTTDEGKKTAFCEVTVVLPMYVVINNLKWATGNLVSTSTTAGAVAENTNGSKVKIGAPTDGGLYFQFGSLIGYKGGSEANNGSGVGSPSSSNTNWGVNPWSWEKDAMVYPEKLIGTPSMWPQQSTVGTNHKWYFSGKGVASGEINATDVANGVGDPCAYYLGGTWRLPTSAEQLELSSNMSAWTTNPVTGRWFGPDPGNVKNSIFFPGSGYRRHTTGAFGFINLYSSTWSSTIDNPDKGYYLYFNDRIEFVQQTSNFRPSGMPVRCVSE